MTEILFMLKGGWAVVSAFALPPLAAGFAILLLFLQSLPVDSTGISSKSISH